MTIGFADMENIIKRSRHERMFNGCFQQQEQPQEIQMTVISKIQVVRFSPDRNLTLIFLSVVFSPPVRMLYILQR